MYDRREVEAAVDLVSLADRLSARTRDGPLPTWPCPDEHHEERSGQQGGFVVYSTQRGEQRWQCTSCGAGGTSVDLVAASTGVTLADALRRLADQAGVVPLPYGHDERRGAGRREARRAAGPSVAESALEEWVQGAAARLWQPEGEAVRRWLTEDRGLPADVLRSHGVGATTITPDGMLPTRRSVQGARAASPAAVLPARHPSGSLYIQLRLARPASGRPRYLHLPGQVSRPPALGLFRPTKRRHSEVIVTEGFLDALSASAAGYRAATVFSPSRLLGQAAHRLARLDGRLVIAFDADRQGREAAHHLAQRLIGYGRPAAVLSLPKGDLNDTLVNSTNWPRKLAAHVHQAVTQDDRGRALSQ